jgi:hypothetical protein
MRHSDYLKSPYKGIYSSIAAWCNQPQFLKKMSFREFCIGKGIKWEVYKKYKHNPQQYLNDGYKKGGAWKYMEDFEKKYPEIAEKYFDMKFEDFK